MSKMTELASGAITSVDTVTIEPGEAVETPAIVVVRWPAKATVSVPDRMCIGEHCLVKVRERPFYGPSELSVRPKDGAPAATQLSRRGWADRTLEASASCGRRRQ